MKIGQRILKLFSPRAEEARMDMREARCVAEASAEDLSRTLITNSTEIQNAIKQHSKIRNIKGNGSDGGDRIHERRTHGEQRDHDRRSDH